MKEIGGVWTLAFWIYDSKLFNQVLIEPASEMKLQMEGDLSGWANDILTSIF